MSVAGVVYLYVYEIGVGCDRECRQRMRFASHPQAEQNQENFVDQTPQKRRREPGGSLGGDAA